MNCCQIRLWQHKWVFSFFVLSEHLECNWRRHGATPLWTHWSVEPLSGREQRPWRTTVQRTDLCNCLNEAHMLVISILSLRGPMVQYEHSTQCALWPKITRLRLKKSLQLVRIVLPFHRIVRQLEKEKTNNKWHSNLSDTVIDHGL